MSEILSEMGEFGLIDTIGKNLKDNISVITGIGDDTAVVKTSLYEYTLLTTDMIVEDVHFTKDDSPKFVGYKALACNISDIASMGGLPCYVLVSLGIAREMNLEYVKDIYAGINMLADKYHITIVGGDTVKSDKCIINIALTGEVKSEDLIKRSGACVGDKIFVTGGLGNSFKSGKHLSFMPRLKEARYLVKHCKPSAMIDISDGLVADLKHILDASKVGAYLLEDNIPLNEGASLDDALYEGEDFELLFTLSQEKDEGMLKKNIDMDFIHIGEILDIKKGYNILDKNGDKREVEVKGYQHF